MVDLTGLHLLVTRPEAQALPWAAQLMALGARVTCQPFLVIRPVADAAAQQAIKDRVLSLDEYHKAIFVSQNAVRYGMAWIDRYWPQAPAGLEYFAVGASTAELLQQSLDHWGARVRAPVEAMDSEALLSLPELQAVNNNKIAVFRGLGGRTLMAQVLKKRGASVDYCELYERTRPEPEMIDVQKLQYFKSSPETPVVTVHSGETLGNVDSVLSERDRAWMKRQALLVPGKRVADIAGALKFQTIIVAENATHNCMTEALYDWRQQYRQG